MNRFCQYCEKPIVFAEVLVSLPPHGDKDIKRVCFECGLLLVNEYNKERGIGTKKILIIKKGDQTNESV